MKQQYSYYTLAGVSYPYCNFSSIPRGKPSFQKWEPCVICGDPFPVGDLTYYQGKGYCRKNGCDKDLEQIRRAHRKE